jgi:hypothetical protein
MSLRYNRLVQVLIIYQSRRWTLINILYVLVSAHSFLGVALIETSCAMGLFAGLYSVPSVFITWWTPVAHNPISARLYDHKCNRLLVGLPPTPSINDINTVSCRVWILLQGYLGVFPILMGFHDHMPTTHTGPIPWFLVQCIMVARVYALYDRCDFCVTI